MPEIIKTSKAPAAIGPYSQAVRIGGLLFLSGQIPISPETGEIIDGTVTEQAEQVIKNIKEVLSAGGSSLSQVVKTTCFLQSMNDFAAFNGVYGKHFVKRPARSCVEVSALPKGALVEIEVIAAVSQEG